MKQVYTILPVGSGASPKPGMGEGTGVNERPSLGVGAKVGVARPMANVVEVGETVAKAVVSTGLVGKDKVGGDGCDNEGGFSQR